MPRTEASAHQLIGRDVRVTTIDGRVLEFRLSKVTRDALVGEHEQVRFDEIALLERRDHNITKSWVFWVATGAATALAALVLFAYGLSQSI